MTHIKQMSAAAFAKGLLDLEGQLTPILVYDLPINIMIFFFFLHGYHLFSPSSIYETNDMGSMIGPL